ncbi:MAG: hypothetical protein ACK5LV_04325 [Lachnospirales bacterium]
MDIGDLRASFTLDTTAFEEGILNLNTLIDGFIQQSSNINLDLSSLDNSFFKPFTTGFENLMETMGNFIERNGILGENLTNLQVPTETAISCLQGFRDGLSETLLSSDNFALVLPERFSSAFINVKNFFSTFVLDLTSGFTDFCTSFLSSNTTFLGSFCESSINGFNQTFQSVLGALGIFANSSLGGFSSLFTNVLATTSTFLGGLFNSFSVSFTDINTSLNTFTSGFLSGIGDYFNSFKSSVSSGLDSIKNTFLTFVSSGLNYGANFMQGFIDGINSKISSVISAVSNITNKAKDYIGFNSPSKKGEGRNIVLWGENMVKGFNDGLQKGARNLDFGFIKEVKGENKINNNVLNQNKHNTENSNISIYGNSFYVNEENDIQKIAKELYKMTKKNI